MTKSYLLGIDIGTSACKVALFNKEGQSLTDLYEERVPLYEKYADIVVDEEGKNLEESLDAVLEILKKKAK